MSKRAVVLLGVMVGVMGGIVGLGGCGASDRGRAGQGEAVLDLGRVRRVTTGVPFPRGLAMKDGTLYVLSRGRVRDAGGTDPTLEDKAGTIWAVDAGAGEPLGESVSEDVRANARPLAEPTEPPFRLLDRSVGNALDDRRTDRPYCILRYDERSRSFYFCAFSGIDRRPPTAAYPTSGPASAPAYASRPDDYFRKNTSDAVYRYDTRTSRWQLLYRSPAVLPPAPSPFATAAATKPVTTTTDPWLSGPDNCLVVGTSLYVACKESSTLVRFDLGELERNPYGTVGPRQVVAGPNFVVDGKRRRYLGHSMLAVRGEWLYVGFRTSSVILRVRLADLPPAAPARAAKPPSTPDEFPAVPAQLLARFDPYDRATGRSADLTDMAFGPALGPGDGSAGESGSEADLYVVSARPARVYRFRPDPEQVFDARTEAALRTDDAPPLPDPAERHGPWADLSELTGNAKMKCEAIFVDSGGRVYVTSADRVAAAHGESGLAGVVYRIDPGAAPSEGGR